MILPGGMHHERDQKGIGEQAQALWATGLLSSVPGAGSVTSLLDSDSEYLLKSALSKINKFLDGSVERGKMSQQDAGETLSRISTTTDFKEVAGKGRPGHRSHHRG